MIYSYMQLNGGISQISFLIQEVEQMKPDAKESILHDLYKNRNKIKKGKPMYLGRSIDYIG